MTANAPGAGAPERSIRLEVVTPERRIVGESVDEVILPGSQGYLGVRPGHAPLLTDLGIGTVSYRKGSETRYLSLAWGFAEVLPNRVSVLAEIAERAEEIDRDRAEKARDRAIGRLKGRGDETDFKRAQIALEKSLIRIQVAAKAGSHEPA